MEAADPFNERYADNYFTPSEGYQESAYVFAGGSGALEACRARPQVSIAEFGFGTGLNLWALLSELLSESSTTPQNLAMSFLSVDHTLMSPEQVRALLSPWSEMFESLGGLERVVDVQARLCVQQLPVEPAPDVRQVSANFGGISVNLRVFRGQVRDFVRQPALFNPKPEFWFFDGHSPDRNPQMWQQELFEAAGCLSAPGARFSTYSAAGTVKRALRGAGWTVRRTKGYGRKHHMTYGEFEP